MHALPFVLLLSAGAAAQHSAFEASLSRFEAKIAGDVAKDGLGSISAAVAVEDRVVWAKGFGWADVARRVSADSETIYRVGSISKSITAVWMACLLQDGKLDLDDPIVGSLPDLKTLDGSSERSAAVTFRHLASHTAGLIREPRLRGAAAGPITDWEKKVIASIATTSFHSDPGKRYQYSNIGYGILGLTLSRVAKKPFMQQVEARIFSPLKMTSSTFILNDAQRARLAIGYVTRRGKVSGDLPALEHAGRGYKVPNGGVYSTAGDLCRFAMELTGASPKPIFTAKTRAEVLTVQTPGDKNNGYGLGFSIRKLESGVRAIGHGGSVAGYNAYLVFDPDSKIVVAMLRNYNRGATSLGAAAKEVLGELVVASKK
jgi:CubicO group peptidase (beta-lactamase class C family)